MKLRPLNFSSVAVIIVVLSGCATVAGPPPTVNIGIVPTGQMVPLANPMPVKTIEVWDEKMHKRREADVLSLKPAEIRKRLNMTETLVAVEKRDTSGSLSYLGAGGKVARGKYRVTMDYVNYMNENITFTDTEKNTAIGKIGVGARIVAELETQENGVDLGGLFSIGLAVQDKKVVGQLNFFVYGLSNDKLALAVPSQAPLDISSIQKAFESAAAVRVLFGQDDSSLEPYLLGVANVKPSNVRSAFESAQKQFIK